MRNKKLRNNTITTVIITISAILLIIPPIISTANKNIYINEAKKYLSTRYNYNFMLSPTENSKDADYIYEFEVYPMHYEDLLFTINRKYSSSGTMKFPFIPGFIKDDVISTDFESQIIEWVIKHNYQIPFSFTSEDNLDIITNNVYELLEKINNQLSIFNIKTTKYSCSATLSVVVNGHDAQIKFYVLDKDVIYHLLLKATSHIT